MGDYLILVGFDTWFARDIGHQLLATTHCIVDDGDRLTNLFVLTEHTLQFTRLDPEAADFYLLVESAQELDVSVGQIADPVAGAIDRILRITCHRIGDESLTCQFRLVQIAESESIAGGQQFAGDSHGHGLQMFINDVHASVGDRPADENGSGRWRFEWHVVAAGEGRILCRAIAVDQSAMRVSGLHPDDVGHRQDISAGQQLLQTAETMELFIHHEREQAGCEPERGNTLLADRLP